MHCRTIRCRSSRSRLRRASRSSASTSSTRCATDPLIVVEQSRRRRGQGRARQGRAGRLYFPQKAGQGAKAGGRMGQGRAGCPTLIPPALPHPAAGAAADGAWQGGQSRAGQGRAGQGRAGQGRAGQGKEAGQGRAGQGKPPPVSFLFRKAGLPCLPCRRPAQWSRHCHRASSTTLAAASAGAAAAPEAAATRPTYSSGVPNSARTCSATSARCRSARRRIRRSGQNSD